MIRRNDKKLVRNGDSLWMDCGIEVVRRKKSAKIVDGGGVVQ